MKPYEHKAGHYLQGDVQIHVPPYQRPYSWTDDRLVDLWRDVANQYRSAAGAGIAKKHFMGALIVEPHVATNTAIHPVSVIDGQQRLLTMITLLAGLRDHMASTAGSAVDQENDLRLILPKYAASEVRVIPKEQDQPALESMLRGEFLEAIPDQHFDHTLSKAYRFFRYQLWLGEQSLTSHKLNLPPKPARGKSALREAPMSHGASLFAVSGQSICSVCTLSSPTR